MDWIDYLRVLRHRWKIVAATLLIALVAAWVTTSVAAVGSGDLGSLYRATTVLLNTGTVEALGLNNLETAGQLVTIGEVPIRVQKKLELKESPQSLAAKIESTVDVQTGVVRISATSPFKDRAEELASTFANELIGFLIDRKARNIATQADSLTKELAELRAEINFLDGRVARAVGVAAQQVAITERDAKIRQYGFVYEFYNRLSATSTEAGQLQVLQEGEGLPVARGGFTAPRSRSGRLMLGGILGLMAGGAVALVLERLDTRIRTREEAEESFALPVLAEIPVFGHGDRAYTLETVAHPSSAATHTFRLLRGGIIQEARLQSGWEENGEGRFSGTFLVTSASPGDGKTTVVANLAPVFTEIGLSVMILSCDFRRPEIHKYYRVSNQRGLVDAISAADGWRILEGMNFRTAVREVRLVPSGPVPQNPGELMSSDWMREVLREARRSADVVLVDTAPILAASDASNLLPHVDGVIVVSRAGKASTEVAQRTTEMLRRLGATTLGLVLNGVRSGSLMARGYYEYTGDRPASRFSRFMHRTRRGRAPTNGATTAGTGQAAKPVPPGAQPEPGKK
jgi:capsular exopolysaccharide synthesis family protein